MQHPRHCTRGLLANDRQILPKNRTWECWRYEYDLLLIEVFMSSTPMVVDSPREPTESGRLARAWPARPSSFPDLMRPIEAAQYLRLDELGTHTPESALRTLNYWRDKGHLKATKYARHVWYRKSELDRFLAVKTEA